MDAAEVELTGLKSATQEALKAVHARSGGRADIYLLGYPRLINTDTHEVGLAYDFGKELADLQRRGDAAQRAGMAELDRSTSGRGGFTFVDVKPDWGGFTHGQPRQLGAPTTRTATYRVAGNAQVQQDKWLRRAKAEQLCGGTTQPDLSWEMSFVGETTAATSGSVELTATVSCQLTAAPQIDAVTQDTDAVFLTIGGNDVNFSGIVLQCMVLRSATGCESTIAAADAALPDLRDRTAAALQAIHDRSRGNAEVHLVGYPNLLNTASYSIPEAAPTYDAGAALFAMQARGDELQAKGVAELDAADTGPHGYTFVDVKPAWDGLTHGLDPRTTPDNSQAWLVPVLAPGSQLPEWVHPTQQGYAATAEAIIDVMR